MNGLYFYKLVSPYAEDVTKDCKLTINEIDHNFLTLKDADIKDGTFNGDENTIVLNRNNGDKIVIDMSSVLNDITYGFDVEYIPNERTIKFKFNGEEYDIKGLLNDTSVITDYTLSGNGLIGTPLSLAVNERTGTYKPVKALIDLTQDGSLLPSGCDVGYGDRYIVKDEVSIDGFLYDYCSVNELMDSILKGSEWRVPTKDDWDNMLNAIECPEDRNHGDKRANRMLGKCAGTELKSTSGWTSGVCDGGDCKNTSKVEKCGSCMDADNFNGTDDYGMGIMPVGYGDDCSYDYEGERTAFWTNTEVDGLGDVYVKRFDFNKSGVYQTANAPSDWLSIRLVKEYNGSNYANTELINGQPYETVLIPSENAELGYTIWTKTNISIPTEHYRKKEDITSGETETKTVFSLYEWDGKKWQIKTIGEGESVVIKESEDGVDIEYRIIEGELKKVSDEIKEEVISAISETIETISGDIVDIKAILDKYDFDAMESAISALTDDMSALTELVNEIEGNLISGGEVNISDGTITLSKNNGDDIVIDGWESNYGTF